MQRVLLTVTFLCMSLLMCGLKPAQEQQLPEYQVKAVFLFNFSQFVQWPNEAFTDNKSPFVIGVLGEDPFDPYLEETVREENLNNRTFVIKKYSSVENVKDCHILFINEPNKDKAKTILGHLAGKPILTVSDIEGFGEMGGMIAFEKQKNRIRLKINQGSAKNAHLEISSKLLRLAEIVSTEKTNK